MLIGNAAVFALADALAAAESGRAVPAAARTIFIPAKLVRELLRTAGRWRRGRPRSSMWRARRA